MRLDAYAHDRDRLSETGHLLENISVGGKCGTRTANERQNLLFRVRIRAPSVRCLCNFRNESIFSQLTFPPPSSTREPAKSVPAPAGTRATC